MKKITLFLLLSIAASGALKAQLVNSKWKGIIKIDDDINVTFDFRKDTLTVYNLDENTVIETMTYSATNSTFTLNEISGQSDCDNATPGKYKYVIKGDILSISLLEDGCDDRSSVIKSVQLTRNS